MEKVVITDFVDDDIAIEKSILEPLGCEVLLYHCKTPQELIAAVADADYVITQFAKVNAEVIGAMKKSKIIVRYGIGVDNVDLEAAAKKSIPVCNVPDYCIDEVADHTLGLLLSITRIIPYISCCISLGKKVSFKIDQLHVLKEMTVGIIAFGRIGRAVAERLKGFRCKILVFDPEVDPSAIKKEGGTPVTLEELYAKSDLITLHCPSNPRTKQMINAESIKKMKKGVLIVNASRGDLIKTVDLISSLKSGQVSGAALDVTDPEPLNDDSPLLKMDNVLITSHIASGSVNAVRKLKEGVAHRVACAVQGKELPNVVNNIWRVK